MYQLFVLVCLISNTSACVTLQDLYSPHDTHDKCLARAYVISQELTTYMPKYRVRSYKCFDLEGELYLMFELVVVILLIYIAVKMGEDNNNRPGF